MVSESEVTAATVAGTESVIHTFGGKGRGRVRVRGTGRGRVRVRGTGRGRVRVRVRVRASEPRLLEERRRAILAQEAPPALLREDAVGDEARDHARPRLGSVVSSK